VHSLLVLLLQKPSKLPKLLKHLHLKDNRVLQRKPLSLVLAKMMMVASLDVVDSTLEDAPGLLLHNREMVVVETRTESEMVVRLALWVSLVPLQLVQLKIKMFNKLCIYMYTNCRDQGLRVFTSFCSCKTTPNVSTSHYSSLAP
jgi:hypothetical protein